MSNQPDIGWCPCCKRAVVEMPAGSCSNCSNHTMNLMSTYDHEEELAATKQKLEAAEQAIRESQEQEPASRETLIDAVTYRNIKLYTKPMIIPQSTEQRHIKELRDIISFLYKKRLIR